MSPSRLSLALVVVALGVAACDSAAPTFPDRVVHVSGGAVGDPLPFLDAREQQLFLQGGGLFDRVFTPATGLGPLFNGSGCGKCHDTPAPGGVGVEAAQHATAFRGGVCDDLSAEGGPVIQVSVTPALHDALGIYEEPVPPEATATARRTTPALWGSGLLDAVPDSAILAHADPDDRDGDGVSGRPNYTADGRLGRFGRKAQVATLREFIAEAYSNEIGITNPMFPAEQTVGGKPLPAGVDPTPDPEISQDDLDATEAFVRFLAPPQATASSALRAQGTALFERVGCAACHVPELQTGPNPVPALSRQVVPAYSDLLLHEMGPDLADICMGLATPGEFRTEPLWGLRYRFEFLHDGRAKTIEDAIRMHGGEASGARDRFLGLTDTERALLLNFLGAL